MRPLAFVVAVATLAVAGPVSAAGGRAAFDALAREYLAHRLDVRPHDAAAPGAGDADERLVPVTEALLEQERAWYRDFDARLAAFTREHPPATLPVDRTLELEVLAARVARERLELETLRPYERDPAAYLPIVTGSIQGLVDRRFATSCLSLRAAARRLRLVPEVLRAAKVNLTRPSRPHTEAAIERYAAALEFYRLDLPAAARACRDPATQGLLAEADSLAVRAVEDFLAFLREDLLPRSDDAFAIGAAAHAAWLRAAEGEVSPAESLVARGLAGIEAAHARMLAVAGGVAPGADVAEALDSLAAPHPADTSFAGGIAARFGPIRDFLRARAVLAVPDREAARVRPTPAWARTTEATRLEAGGGPRGRAEAYLDATPAGRAGPPAPLPRARAELRALELLPGRYYQNLAARANRSRLRRALPSRAFTDGWAHYAAGMMLEQGFGAAEPRLELARLQSELECLGRLVAGVSLHARGWSLEQATAFLRDQCRLDPARAAQVARHAAVDLDAIAGALGRWRILDLRAEAARALGERFDLRAFHDALLRQGPLPLPRVRQAVLRELGVPAAAESAGR